VAKVLHAELVTWAEALFKAGAEGVVVDAEEVARCWRKTARNHQGREGAAEVERWSLRLDWAGVCVTESLEPDPSSRSSSSRL